MLTQLSTVKSRLALTVTDYDGILTSAIKAISDSFDKETNRTLARTVSATRRARTAVSKRTLMIRFRRLKTKCRIHRHSRLQVKNAVGFLLPPVLSLSRKAAGS